MVERASELLRSLRDLGPCTRTQLAENLGTSRSTINAELATLIDSGFVQDAPAPVSSGGRPSAQVQLHEGLRVVAVSIGETRAQPRRVLMVGGATRSPALRALAPAVLGRPVVLPPSAEYVALGAARQAAWALAGTDAPPTWASPEGERLEAAPTPEVRAAYGVLRDSV